MGKSIFAILVVGLLASGFIFYITYLPFAQEKQVQPHFVQRVIDGDTLVLANGQRVRLIGIDSPEKGSECFEASKQFLQNLVSGKAVELAFDAEKWDKYGRMLAYLYLDGNFVNLVVVKEGFAVAFPFEPNMLHASEFAVAEELAREQKKGCLWAQYG